MFIKFWNILLWNFIFYETQFRWQVKWCNFSWVHLNVTQSFNRETRNTCTFDYRDKWWQSIFHVLQNASNGTQSNNRHGNIESFLINLFFALDSSICDFIPIPLYNDIPNDGSEVNGMEWKKRCHWVQTTCPLGKQRGKMTSKIIQSKKK